LSRTLGPLYLPRRQLTKEAAVPDAPFLSLLTFKRFLRQKSLDFSESEPCLIVQLPLSILGGDSCPPSPVPWSSLDASLTPLFINKVTGGWVVPSTGAWGSWQELEALLTTWVSNRRLARGQQQQVALPPVRRGHLSISEEGLKQWEQALPIQHLETHQFKILLNNFKQLKRDFDVSDFSHFGARVLPDNLNVLLFPVQYINGALVSLRKVEVTESELSESHLGVSEGARESGIFPFIHNLAAAVATGSSHCVIVGSIMDSVVVSRRSSDPVLVLPELVSLHPSLLPFLHQFTSVTIWLGHEIQQGTEAARTFAKKIGESRCRIVPNDFPSALTAVRKRMNIAEILMAAKEFQHKYITTFDSLRHDIYLEFIRAEELDGVKWKRFEGLNSLLKGFRRGEMTMMTGRTGSGKTTFMSEYSLDLCMQGVNTLWGSFEIKNVRLAKMMMKQFSLVNLDEKIEEFDTVADNFQKLPLWFTTFHGSQEVEKVLDAMSHAVYVHDIAHVIIDNVQFMLGSGPGVDRFREQDRCIHKFRTFATINNVHVTLVIHPRKEDFESPLNVYSLFGGGKASQEADNVLLLQEEFRQHSVIRKKSLEVAKNRYAGDLGVIPLVFSKPVLTLSKKVAELTRRQHRKTLRLVEKGDTVTEEVLVPPDIQDH